MFKWLLLCVLGVAVSAKMFYRDSIPNGSAVPHPCDTSQVWDAAGHLDPSGGGALTPFGMDFKAQGYDWNLICRMDSDGDGTYNGRELGDPDCVWMEGDIPSSDATGHPGIDERTYPC